jgi:hypothetical protein
LAGFPVIAAWLATGAIAFYLFRQLVVVWAIRERRSRLRNFKESTDLAPKNLDS